MSTLRRLPWLTMAISVPEAGVKKGLVLPWWYFSDHISQLSHTEFSAV
jgi:hypothetical protein